MSSRGTDKKPQTLRGLMGSVTSSVKNRLSRSPSMKSTSSRESYHGSPISPSFGPTSPISGPSSSTVGTAGPLPSKASVNPFSDAASSEAGPSGAYDNAPPPAYGDIAAPSISVQAPSGTPFRATSPTPSAASGLSVTSLTKQDDQYAFLTEIDTVLLLDDSGSMKGQRWAETGEVVSQIAPICAARDSDGIDVYFLNNKTVGKNLTSPAQVQRLFRDVKPSGITLTGKRIHAILGPYVKNYCERVEKTKDPYETGVKPVNLIVITDGAPTDDPEDTIQKLAGQLDKVDAPCYQVGIQFFQVGDDPDAKAALEELDNNLGQKHDCRDMVDTVTWNGPHYRLDANTVLKTVLGGVVKRLDRKEQATNATANNLLRPR